MFDVGASYELPVYTQEQYYIGRQRAALFLGGRNSVTLTLYVVRLSFFLDFWPYKMTFENYADYNLLGTESKVCLLGTYLTDLLRLQLYTELDYLNCSLGILGSFIPNDKSYPCEWQTYYVNRPLLDILLATDSTSELYRSVGCEDREISRYDV